MPKYRGLLWLTSLMLLVTACTSPTQTTQPQNQGGGEPHKGGVLRIAWMGNPPKVLHPYPDPPANTSTLGDVAGLFTAGLLSFNWDTLEYWVSPDDAMATAMPTVSADSRTYTFTLRDDLKWSDGKPVTSADFQFAWDNASKEENEYVGIDDLDRIESYRTPDPKTIVVTLKEPLARDLALSTVTLTPMPRQVWQGKPWLDPTGNPEILKPTVVAGPFIPKEVSAERVVLVRNAAFWGKQPLLDEIDFLVSRPETVLNLVKTNGADWAEQFPPSQYEDAKKISSLNVLDWQAVAGNSRSVEFNLRRPILQDKRVREGLVRALNRDDFIQFEDNLAFPQYTFIPTSNTKWANDSVEKYAYDLNKAKQLLRDAGFTLDGSILKDRSGQPVTLEIVYPTTSQPRAKMATYIQQQWKQLGIDTTVTGLEFNTFVERTQSKNFDVTMGSWGNGLDPDGAKTWIKTDGPQNNTGYSNPRIDELIEQGKVEQNDQRRKQIYDEMQRIVADDLPVFYTTTTKAFTAFDKKVGGVRPSKSADLMPANNQIVSWYIAQ